MSHINFKLNQDVTVTRNGKTESASFIGYMSNGYEAQVCMKDRPFKPNIIVPTGQIADVIFGSKPTRKPKAETQVADAAPA